MNKAIRKGLSLIAVICVIIGAGTYAQASTSAALVVYGKIFTSESSKTIEAFVEAGRTEIVDYTGKGLVMPGCGNGHAHKTVGTRLT